MIIQFKKAGEKRPITNYLFIIFLLSLVVMGIALPKGARSLVIQIMIFSIFAMGYDVCLGFTSQCSLGHSAFFGAGAYGAVFSVLYLKLDPLSSLLFSIGAGFILATVIGFINVRLTESYFVVTTAICFSVVHLLAMDMVWLTGGDDGLSIKLRSISLGFGTFSLYDPLVNYYFVLIFLFLSYLILNRIVRSPMGKIFISIRENEKRAKSLGYNVFRYKLAAFIVSGVFASLSGGLYALTLRYVTADFLSFYWSVIPILWCLIGGLGTLIGSWIGAAIMSLFQYYVSAWWTHYMIGFGIVILLILKISYKGIVGYVISKW